jgi:hypothetical protein
MSYDQLQRLIQHTSPAFVCRPAGRGRESERFTARLSHELRPPAPAADLAHLRQLIPAGAEQLATFYALHDGFVLYRDTLSPTAGIELFRIADMEEQTSSLRQWLDGLEDEYDTNHLKTAIAIGEPPHSGNYFAMPTRGPQIGKVFFFDHDDWREEPIAESFDEFLSLLSSSPADLLSKTLGCTTRYFDGSSNTQWIPTEYLPTAAV